MLIDYTKTTTDLKNKNNKNRSSERHKPNRWERITSHTHPKVSNFLSYTSFTDQLINSNLKEGRQSPLSLTLKSAVFLFLMCLSPDVLAAQNQARPFRKTEEKNFLYCFKNCDCKRANIQTIFMKISAKLYSRRQLCH